MINKIEGLSFIFDCDNVLSYPKIPSNIFYYTPKIPLSYKKIPTETRHRNKLEKTCSFDFIDYFDETLLYPFDFTSMMMPHWILDFLGFIFKPILSTEEIDFIVAVNKVLTIVDPVLENKELDIGDYSRDSLKMYNFKKELISTIVKYGDKIKESSYIKIFIKNLLILKTDKYVINMVDKLKDKYTLSYRPEIDFYLISLYLFAITPKNETVLYLKSFLDCDIAKQPLSAKTKSTFEFRESVPFINGFKNQCLGFSRVFVYELLKDFNIIVPINLLRQFKIQDVLKNSINEYHKGIIDYKDFIYALKETISMKKLFESFLGSKLKDYNKFRAELGYPNLNIKGYITDNKGCILFEDSKEDTDVILNFLMNKDTSISKIIYKKDDDVPVGSAAIRSAIANDDSINIDKIKDNFDFNDALGVVKYLLKNIIFFRKDLNNLIAEEENFSIRYTDKDSFFYTVDSSVSNLDIEFLISTFKSSYLKKKKKNKISYEDLKNITEQGLDGANLKIILKKFNIKIKNFYSDVEAYFGSKIVSNIKKIQNKKYGR